MNEVWIMIWTILILTSIAWYALLLFLIGARGAREIRDMTRSLATRNEAADKKETS
jgi:hypothetical protein